MYKRQPRDYSYSIPKKMKRLALKSSLTSKANDGDIIVLDSLSFGEIKTKNMVNVLRNLGVDNTCLLYTSRCV